MDPSIGKSNLPPVPPLPPFNPSGKLEQTKRQQPDSQLVEQGPIVSPEVARLLSAGVVIKEKPPQLPPRHTLTMTEALNRLQIKDQKGEARSFAELAQETAATTATITEVAAGVSGFIGGAVNFFKPIPEHSAGAQASAIVPGVFSTVAHVATAIELTTKIPEYQKRQAKIEKNNEKLKALENDLMNPASDKKEISYQIAILKNKIADLEKAQNTLQQKVVTDTLQIATGSLLDASAIGTTFAHGTQAAHALSIAGDIGGSGASAIGIATASAAIIEDIKSSEKVISEFDKLKAMHIALRTKDPSSPLLPIIGAKILQLQQQNDDLIASLAKNLVVLTTSSAATTLTISALAGAAVGSTGGIVGIAGAIVAALGGMAYAGYKNREYIKENVILEKINQVVNREVIAMKKNEAKEELAESMRNIKILTKHGALELINQNITSLLHAKEALIAQQEKASYLESLAISIKIGALDSRIKSQVDDKLELLEDTGYNDRYMELLQEELEARSLARKNFSTLASIDRSNVTIGKELDEKSKNIEYAKAMMGLTYEDILGLRKELEQAAKTGGAEIQAFLKEMNHDFDPLEFKKDPVSVILDYIAKQQTST